MSNSLFHPVFLQRALRFSLSGLMVTALHVVIAFLFIELVMPAPSLANGVAFFLATIISYLVNTLWSFSSPLHGKNLVRFIIVSCVGLLLAMTVSGMAQAYALNYWYGIAAVVCVVPPTTFILHNFWTYR